MSQSILSVAQLSRHMEYRYGFQKPYIAFDQIPISEGAEGAEGRWRDSRGTVARPTPKKV